MKVIDIKTPDNVDEYWKKKIEDYCAEHITEKTEPHKYLNYQKENLNIEKHLYFSALYDGEQLVCFSGIYNGGRYSPWIHRLLNRTYLVPAYRTTVFKKKETYYSTEYIASHQLKLWKDPQILFISMQEHRRSQRIFSFLHKTIKGFENQVWTDVTGFAQVVQGSEQNCFQKVSYSNFSSSEKPEFNLPIISEEEYKKRFL